MKKEKEKNSHLSLTSYTLKFPPSTWIGATTVAWQKLSASSQTKPKPKGPLQRSMPKRHQG